MSSTPLSGKFILTCVNADTSTADTTEISYDATPATVKEAIYVACPSYRDKIEIWTGTKYAYTANGREYYIKFFGISGDVPAFSLQSGVVTPLNGN